MLQIDFGALQGCFKVAGYLKRFRFKTFSSICAATVDLADEGNRFVVCAELPGDANDKIGVALTSAGFNI